MHPTKMASKRDVDYRGRIKPEGVSKGVSAGGVKNACLAGVPIRESQHRVSN